MRRSGTWATATRRPAAIGARAVAEPGGQSQYGGPRLHGTGARGGVVHSAWHGSVCGAGPTAIAESPAARAAGRHVGSDLGRSGPAGFHLQGTDRICRGARAAISMEPIDSPRLATSSTRIEFP